MMKSSTNADTRAYVFPVPSVENHQIVGSVLVRRPPTDDRQEPIKREPPTSLACFQIHDPARMRTWRQRIQLCGLEYCTMREHLSKSRQSNFRSKVVQIDSFPLKRAKCQKFTQWKFEVCSISTSVIFFGVIDLHHCPTTRPISS